MALMLKNARLIDPQIGLDEVADILETCPAKMNGVFTVGDLKYLARTGRLSGTAAVIGLSLIHI